MPRPPVRLKAWRGPLPPKRITPSAILADFVLKARNGVVAAATTASMGGGRPSPEKTTTLASAVRPRFEPPEAGLAFGGLQSRWAGFGHALMGLQRDPRRSSRPTDDSHAVSFTNASSCTDSRNAASPRDRADLRRRAVGSSISSSSTAASSRAAWSRSFVDVVAGRATSSSMAGPSRPSAPQGLAATAPTPAAAPSTMPAVAPGAGSGAYLGPPGFQGWPAAAPMPPPQAAPSRPYGGFCPQLSVPIPPTQYMPQQPPYPQYQGQFYHYPQQVHQPLSQPSTQQAVQNPPAQP
jgi:hypothetical protein